MFRIEDCRLSIATLGSQKSYLLDELAQKASKVK